MAGSNSASTSKRQKRQADRNGEAPSKVQRVASPKRDEEDQPTASSAKDPMEALDGDGDDPMDKLATQAGETDQTIVPTRADEFEQTAEREVEAAKGLDGKVEEGKMKLVHEVRHQVAVPPTYPYVPISQHKRNDPPAREYSFTLDPFQYVATSCIERNESVLVSAHTSAGKTVVAEFAIATCLKEGRRVVYTSPIKVRS